MVYADYVRPTSLNDALQTLASGSFKVLAGGTDLYPAHSDKPISSALLDITGVADLAGIQHAGGMWRIGATTTWSAIARASLPAQFHGLQVAAREVGGIQIQNTGTIAGNLCNASPAADGIPALLALDAELELASVRGSRRLTLEAFLLGSRKTVLEPDELVTAVWIPQRSNARTTFLKLGHRRYLVISIVMVSALLEVEHGSIQHAAVSVGSCSAVARRLHALEQKLVGQTTDCALDDLITTDDLTVLTPIDDVRGSATYRSDAATTLVRRALAEAMHE